MGGGSARLRTELGQWVRIGAAGGPVGGEERAVGTIADSAAGGRGQGAETRHREPRAGSEGLKDFVSGLTCMNPP